MAGKGKKKRNSKDSTGSNDKPSKKGAGGGKSKGKKSAGKGKSSKFQGDLFSEAAIENAYLVCHNIQVKFKRVFIF